MTNDDLLREASDPTTPGKRLLEMSSPRNGPVDPEVLDAINANPNLPPARLGFLLEAGVVSAWRNPAVPLFLQQQPLPGYRYAAGRMLHAMSRSVAYQVTGDMTPVTLESEVRGWVRTLERPIPDRAEPVRAYARYLASLFGLPWPG